MELQKAQPRWRSRVRDMHRAPFQVVFPRSTDPIPQDAEWAEVVYQGRRDRLRFHDYHRIYTIPGLYEHLFYEKLHCCSPSRVAGLLQEVVEEGGGRLGDLSVLDLGAGNGMVGDELHSRGVPRIIGADIIPEARDACRRDRPGVYADYLVADFTSLPEQQEQRLRQARLNCLTTVAALGFGDIPSRAFLTALDLISTPAWVAFNIKEAFLEKSDATGFAGLIHRLIEQRVLRMEAYRRYRHRVSMTGRALHYVAIVARKLQDVPDRLMNHPDTP